MSDLDALLDGLPVTPPSLTGATGKPKKCRRHQWEWCIPEGGWRCHRCSSLRDPARSKMGKAVLMRSKREERGLAKNYGGKRTGHFGGPDDVQTEIFNVQSKVSPHWFVERYWLELQKLPRTGGRVPMLVVSDGGPGQHVRRMVIVEERDWRELHGGPKP